MSNAQAIYPTIWDQADSRPIFRPIMRSLWRGLMRMAEVQSRSARGYRHYI